MQLEDMEQTVGSSELPAAYCPAGPAPVLARIIADGRNYLYPQALACGMLCQPWQKHRRLKPAATKTCVANPLEVAL